MKGKLLFTCLMVSFYWQTVQRKAAPPEGKITNRLISARLYLPDADKGYYRATRFDWSGLVASLEYKGHSFFGQWFENYSPFTHDAVSGPVESFGPLGYEEALPGGRFIMIGIGALQKTDEKQYNSFTFYNIINPGKWIIKKKKDGIEFSQELEDSTGYGYIYTKTVRLVKGKPQMILEHSLKNIGKRAIETDVFDHNFPMIDKQPTGPEMKVIFPFVAHAEGKGFGTIVKTNGKELVFLQNLQKKEQVYSAGIQGFGNTAADYDIKIENEKTGAGIRITCDQALKKLVFWACSTTVCPEPYITIKVLPGKEFRWNISYEFYTFPPDKSHYTN